MGRKLACVIMSDSEEIVEEPHLKRKAAAWEDDDDDIKFVVFVRIKKILFRFWNAYPIKWHKTKNTFMSRYTLSSLLD